MRMSMLHKLTYTLLVIGGLNWGLVGFFKYNLVDKIFSTDLSRVIYSVVGLAAVYGVFSIAIMKSKAQK